MKWKMPAETKIYEALGAIADGRVEMQDETAKVYSSSRNKFYDVRYDRAAHAIMANDNGSFYRGYLGYPAIAYLMLAGDITYDPKVAEILKGIAWKDINQKFKNDFAKALQFILADKSADERAVLTTEVEKISEQVTALNLALLGPKTKPPEGY